MPEIYERLQEERKRLALTQQEIADLCGIGVRSQRNYESGERMPDATYLAALAAAGADVLRNAPAWVDRGSLVFSGFMRGSVTTAKIGDKSVAVVEYLTKVNAKNSYGGYVGEKPAICYANMGETTILSIKTF